MREEKTTEETYRDMRASNARGKKGWGDQPLEQEGRCRKKFHGSRSTSRDRNEGRKTEKCGLVKIREGEITYLHNLFIIAFQPDNPKARKK